MQTVDLSRLSDWTYVLVEAEHIYSLLPLNRTRGLVQIESSHPRFKTPLVGQYISAVDPRDSKIQHDRQLVVGCCMQIRLASGVFVSLPVTTVKVVGKGWSYEL